MATINLNLPAFEIRGATTIRENILRDLRTGFARLGVAVNVTPGSDWFLQAQAFANQLEPAESNAVVKVASVMPDEADDTDLARLAAQYKCFKSPAAASAGPVIFDTTVSGTTNIVAGTTIIDGAGLKYSTVSTGNYSNGDTILIAATDKGKGTNHAAGDVLRWTTKPLGANEKMLVGVGGLINGKDVDDDEVLRAKLFAKLQVPPGNGNAQHIAEIAEASSASVSKAFINAALQGAGTMHVAVVAAPTDTNKSRVVASGTMSGTVVPYVTATVPQHVGTTTTTVADVVTDVAFGLTLPELVSNGWKDASPWPVVDASTTWKVAVTAVASSLQFTVDAATPPTAGVSTISWIDESSWTVKEATVLSFTGTSGAYVVTLNTPFSSVATGDFIWPACVNSQTYLNSVLAAYALMGPGEKTTNVSALVRSFRRPKPSASWPYSLGQHLTKAITDNAPQSEVGSAQFFYRTDGTTTLSGSGGLVNPQVPGSVAAAPNIFIPRNIGFYRVP